MQLAVLVSGVFSATLEQLAPVYSNTTGVPVASELAPSMGDSPGSIPNRLNDGDAADVVIMVEPDLSRLEDRGKVLPGSVVALATSLIAMAVPFGAPVPDIGTEDGLRRAILGAASIAVSESASGVYVKGELLDRLGIRHEAAGKITVVKSGPIGEAVARGEFAIGFQQLAELMPVARIQIAGLLPDAVQHVTVVAAAVGGGARHVDAARGLVEFLASACFQALLQRNGLQPPPGRQGV